MSVLLINERPLPSILWECTPWCLRPQSGQRARGKDLLYEASIPRCRMHVLLAAERGFAGCTAADGLRGLSEESAMRHALESAFLAVDREILDRARRERGRDGCCALVAVRIGAASAWPPHTLFLTHLA